MANKKVAMDGNTAAAFVAHKTNEVIAIYPITPSSVMGELSDAWSAKGDKNIWGTIPNVIEMQSEGGASGAVHGSLTAGALTTTFTASQGLLLMIPNMYKIAGELTSTVFHVSARAVASHALSIFGDHSDVMACRQTGWAMLASANPQEVMDFALISQAAALKTRVPFLHFFDGFRTSHELNMVEPLSTDVMRSMISEKLIAEHKARGLNPEKPVLRGTAQNPDVFFQSREAVNRFYDAVPTMVKEAMGQFEKLTGRKYNLFDYVGAPDAERVVVVMASGADTVEDTVNYLISKGEKVGVLKVRLYRPYSEADFIKALPKTVKAIAALDRTKEPGSLGEPLYQDVVTVCASAFKAGALKELPVIVGGRYGLGSKEFTPAMAKGVFENLSARKPVNSFSVGIVDDVTNLSLKYDENFTTEPADTFRALFFGLGSDGTIGANKNTIKIISEETGQYAQGYFVYDSKKAGSMTVSHLRFGKSYLRTPYLVYKARFIGCHQFSFLEKYEMLDKAEAGGIFLLNSPFGAEEVWDRLPIEVQEDIVKKHLKFYVINASKIAEETGMGARINVIMQTAFFGISGVLPKDEAIAAIKASIKKTYSKKGDEVVNKNYAAVDQTLAAIQEVKVGKATSKIKRACEVEGFPKFVRETLCEMIAFRGDQLPVSRMPVDGTFPTATSQYEKRNIALESPVWESHLCIQCGFCSLVCPHAAIRIKAYDGAELSKAPKTFKSMDAKAPALKGMKFTVQVAVEDCTGCGACVYNCPAKERKDGKETGKKAINLAPQFPLRATERENFKFFLSLKDTGSAKVNRNTVQGSQLVRPLFEFSGACAGCGETPYVKLMTQLFGDHVAVANATGCSSIYGANLPTTPYCTREDGRGPAWSNSLFEDNAEFGLGMRLAYDKMGEEARELLTAMKAGPLKAHAKLADDILNADQSEWAGIEQQRGRVADLKKALVAAGGEQAARMGTLADYLIKKSVWILGGDGWAYDIGYGGLDHVLATGKKVRVLVLDTEVYSNTGGQMSKATPLGAVAQFAAGGKPMPKKDLGMISMTYGNIYVAQIAMGADYNQSVKAFADAEAYEGSSIIIAYSHCIAHGIDMGAGMNEQKKAVMSGRWPLFRYNPALRAQGKNPLTIDSKPPTIPVSEFMNGENRFRTLQKSNPEVAARLAKLAEEEYKWRLSVYQQIAQMSCEVPSKEGEKVAA
ncbi:MAG: pyruvate:ferredoxin (flavodoxin) oxidoreductase [Elusimicrobia bacterium]|nr:pyruvate:ferredoxin (flavodoxin) oxidoreductase [Elusimicrobiota bacterium]